MASFCNGNCVFIVATLIAEVFVRLCNGFNITKNKA